jgi:hypothetical protein
MKSIKTFVAFLLMTLATAAFANNWTLLHQHRSKVAVDIYGGDFSRLPINNGKDIANLVNVKTVTSAGTMYLKAVVLDEQCNAARNGAKAWMAIQVEGESEPTTEFFHGNRMGPMDIIANHACSRGRR